MVLWCPYWVLGGLVELGFTEVCSQCELDQGISDLEILFTIR
jgi:hypothetical protein